MRLRRRRAVLAAGAAVGTAALAVVGILRIVDDAPNATRPESRVAGPVEADNGAVAFLRVDGREMTKEGVIPSADIFVSERGRTTLRVSGALYRGAFAWSPDGTRLAYFGARGLYVTGERARPQNVAPCKPPECLGGGDPAWSPSGDRIAFGRSSEGGDGLWVLDLESRDLVPMAEDLLFTGAPSWSLDGRSITVLVPRSEGQAHDVVEIDVSSGEPTRVATMRGIDVSDTVSWAPDRESFAFDSRNGPRPGLYVFGIGSGVERLPVPCPSKTCADIMPSWSPDGEEITFTRAQCELPGSDCFSGDIMSYELASEEVTRVTRGRALDCCAST